MPHVGPMELTIVLIVALLVLGPKRLPDAGRALGQAMRGFKDSLVGTEARAEPPKIQPGRPSEVGAGQAEAAPPPVGDEAAPLRWTGGG